MGKRKPHVFDGYGWGVLLDKWHDEGRTAHLLRGDNSPACGASYYTATRRDVSMMHRCKRCERIERERAVAHAMLMARGAQHDPTVISYPYTLDTPIGLLRVALYEPQTDTRLWVHSRFEDVDRAVARVGSHLHGNVHGMNPYSGKWNFTSYYTFFAMLDSIVFEKETT